VISRRPRTSRGVTLRVKEPALKNITLEIKKGEKLGITGEVGSGKSTLAQLLAHLYKVDRNQIFIRGFDINDIPLSVLRVWVTLIPQDPFLFSQSIEDNIAYGLKGHDGNPNAFSNIEASAKKACIEKEILSLPFGYKTMLGERGINLSGGQKQRVAIARGLVGTSDLIIFDDSTSAVDSETEKELLSHISQEQTLIIISHKPSTLQFCDKIIELKNGELSN
jgi:ATP-binding cassette subfamily B protein